MKTEIEKILRDNGRYGLDQSIDELTIYFEAKLSQLQEENKMLREEKKVLEIIINNYKSNH